MTGEAAINPEVAICDSHHHLWHVPEGVDPMMDALPRKRFMIEEYMAEAASGHNIVSSVFLEAFAFYRADAKPGWQAIGETEFARGQAAMADSRRYGTTRACAALVVGASLQLPDIADILAAHVEAGGGRVRGIRQMAPLDPAGVFPNVLNIPEGFFASREFRAGFERLQDHKMTFDTFILHPQIDDITDLAKAFPDQPIILNHLGGIMRIGSYADDLDGVFKTWETSIRKLSECQNVVMKLGGLGMGNCGFGFDHRETPASSEEIADAWRPFITTAIDAFGADRCMFESNFPVESPSCDFVTLWNAFKRIAADYAPQEQDAMLRGTAERVYSIAA